MALPYTVHRSLNNTRALPVQLELEVSLNLPDGIPLIWSANGKLTPITAATDRPLFILNGAAQTSSTGSLVNPSAIPAVPNQIGNGFNAVAGPGGNALVNQLGGFADVLPVQPGSGVWRTTFTPVIKNFVANTGGSTTSIILPNSPATYAADRFKGGTLFCATTGQQVRITASSSVTSGNPITLTIASPLAAVSDGMTFSATPLGPALSGIKFSAVVSVVADGYVPSQLGVGSADYSGGYIAIQDVDILQGYVYCVFI